MNKAAGNQHLQFTAEICTKEENSLSPAKEEIFQIVTNDKFPFLEMKMSWSPEGDLQFGVLRKKRQQLKYVRNESTHKTGALHAIPLGVLNRLAKHTSRKPSIYSLEVGIIYPDYVNALRKAGLAPPNFPPMGDLWIKQDDKMEIERELDLSPKETEMSTFVLHTHIIFIRLSTGLSTG